jgi:hypothetical protein
VLGIFPASKKTSSSNRAAATRLGTGYGERVVGVAATTMKYRDTREAIDVGPTPCHVLRRSATQAPMLRRLPAPCPARPAPASAGNRLASRWSAQRRGRRRRYTRLRHPRPVASSNAARGSAGDVHHGPRSPQLRPLRDPGPHPRDLPGDVVYVGLALSVCAGSSCLLTAATAGPLAQALCERADLRDARGEAIRFGFSEFLRVGLLSFVIIEAGALIYAAWVLYV